MGNIQLKFLGIIALKLTIRQLSELRVIDMLTNGYKKSIFCLNTPKYLNDL